MPLTQSVWEIYVITDIIDRTMYLGGHGNQYFNVTGLKLRE